MHAREKKNSEFDPTQKEDKTASTRLRAGIKKKGVT